LTSRGDVKAKLEYAFDLYDENNDGILDRTEIKNVIYIMLDVLASDQSHYRKIAKETILQMDTNNDKKITKEEFVDALSTNYALRMLMSPFN
jgi:Ca2+-binding EF-hand superfamily protein